VDSVSPTALSIHQQAISIWIVVDPDWRYVWCAIRQQRRDMCERLFFEQIVKAWWNRCHGTTWSIASSTDNFSPERDGPTVEQPRIGHPETAPGVSHPAGPLPSGFCFRSIE
jgi:hypothetical protein